MLFGIWLYLFAIFGADKLDYNFLPPFLQQELSYLLQVTHAAF